MEGIKQTLKYGKDNYIISKEVYSNDRGKSYLYKNEKNKIIVRFLSEEGMNCELYAYERLKALGIKIPKLLDKNEKENYIVKEHVQGVSAVEYIEKGMLSEEILLKLFAMSEKLNSDNLNANYKPCNYIVDKMDVIYINYEVIPYNEKFDFRNTGIFYWIYNYDKKDRNYLEFLEGSKPFEMAPEYKPFKDKRDIIYMAYIKWKHRISLRR
jgi:tRNA A-37 threonylcarbamoyl transferase component Bud32